MEQRTDDGLSPYRVFSRAEWAARRADTPMTLTPDEVTRVRSLNDRLDIALAAGLHGVHLPGNGLPADKVRPLVKVLGVSVHSVGEALQADHAHADFVVFGPIFDSPGKTAVGLSPLREVAQAVKIPVLAIGGITTKNATDVLEAGASGIAGIRLFQTK